MATVLPRMALLFLLPALLRTEQVPAGAAPRKPVTETLQYAVEWRLIRAGNVKLTWAQQGPQKYKADVHLESAGLVSKLYKVDNDYAAQLEDDFCAISTYLDSEEGSKHWETRVTIDRREGQADYLERDLLKNTVLKNERFKVPQCSADVIGGLMRLRGMTIPVGQHADIPLTTGRKSANVRVEAQESENVKTPAGTFAATRYEVFLLNDVLYRRKGRLHIWLTNDTRKLPVQLRLRLPVLIGTITLQLEREERV